MTVLIFSNLLSGKTGLDKSLVMTANQLHRHGYDLSVINFVGPSDGTQYLVPSWVVDPGIPVIPLQTLPADGGRELHENFHPVIKDRIPNLSFAFTSNQLSALRQLNRTLDEADWIIFTHPLQAQIYKGAIGDEPRRVRTIVQIHGDYKVRHPELAPMLHDACEVVDHVQIVSQGMATDYLELFGARHVHWIPNIHEASKVQRRPHSGINVALVGSFQSAKNQIDAVRMIGRIADESVHLTLWGNDRTPYGHHVRQVVDQLGLETRVHLAGIGSEAEIYGGADIVVIPSRSEGFGYALVEAAAHGLPAVAYDYDYGPRDVIEDGESGFIVDQGDVDSLATRVSTLAASSELRERLGMRALEIFERNFSPGPVVSRYEKLLGPPAAAKASIVDRFATDGVDPVDVKSIRSKDLVIAGKKIGHVVSFSADRPLRRFRVASDKRVKPARSFRFKGRYHIPVLRSDPGRSFRKVCQRVISYETRDAQLGRFYLGNTTKRGEFETLRYLRRREMQPDAPFEVRAGMLSLPRDPHYPVVAGYDSWGSPFNESGSVQLRLTGGPSDPRTSFIGEFDELLFRSSTGPGRFAAPFGYQEMFERLCMAEEEYGLFDYAVAGDIHPWELYRAAFIASMSQALGFWGPQFDARRPATLDIYDGTKSLTDAKHCRRVLFEFPRKPDGIDPRTAGFHDEDVLVIEYPQSFGYYGVHSRPNHYPIHSYNLWRSGNPDLPTVEVDPRPVEEALAAAFEFPVLLGSHLSARVKKFLEEREYFTPVFGTIEPEEVLIPSSYWSAGICEAARRSGAVAADIQYALTSRLHPSFWFGQQPAHGATRFYAWSDFWAARTNAYDEHVVHLRTDWDSSNPDRDNHYDFCVVSQPRVFRRILQFVEALAEANPDARICVSPHPDEREVFELKLAEVSRTEQIVVSPVPTDEAIRRSRIVFGAYSTSMYEAAAMGKPTYVIPTPGSEIAMQDVETGLFRLAEDLTAIEEFEVPAFAATLFGS